jgi:hypothetical protein
MPIRGEATAKLADGETLTLAVNFATLARAADRMQLPAGDVFKVLQDAKSPRQMLAMLAMLEMALKRHHPSMDEDAIGDLMLTDGETLGAALNEAVAGAFGGDDEAEDGDEKNPPIPGTSTPSKAGGRNRAKTPASSGNRRRAAS